MHIAILILLSLTGVVLVALLGRSLARSDGKSERGCNPGQGDQLVDITFGSGGFGGGHGGVIRVTRDPQQYARGYIPRNAV